MKSVSYIEAKVTFRKQFSGEKMEAWDSDFAEKIQTGEIVKSIDCLLKLIGSLLWKIYKTFHKSKLHIFITTTDRKQDLLINDYGTFDLRGIGQLHPNQPITKK